MDLATRAVDARVADSTVVTRFPRVTRVFQPSRFLHQITAFLPKSLFDQVLLFAGEGVYYAHIAGTE